MIETYLEYRRELRRPVSLAISIEPHDKCTVAARLVNLSRSGFGIETDHALVTGQTIRVHLAGLPSLRATVRNCHAGGYGCQLHTTLHPVHYAMLTGKNGAMLAAVA